MNDFWNIRKSMIFDVPNISCLRTPKIENFWRLKKIKAYKSRKICCVKIEDFDRFDRFSEPKNEIFGGI